MLRRANEKDLLKIEELEKECFSTPWTYASILESFSNPLYDFFVYETEEGVVGYSSMFTAVDESDINNIAVTEKCRNKGYGKVLTEALIESVKERKSVSLFLEVRESNLPAIHIYESLGFKEVGYRKNFYSFPTESAKLYKWSLEEME